jgi:hypothetical protein
VHLTAALSPPDRQHIEEHTMNHPYFAERVVTDHQADLTEQARRDRLFRRTWSTRRTRRPRRTDHRWTHGNRT